MIEPWPYIPLRYHPPARLLRGVPSAWRGCEAILEDVLERFQVRRRLAVEFGVDYGYSAVALSNFFDEVVGVDTFRGDVTTPYGSEFHEDGETTWRQARERIAKIASNVRLLRQTWEAYTLGHDLSLDNGPDLVHVDIEHTYVPTYRAVRWAVAHAPMVLVHDTEAFEGVRQAVGDIAQRYGVQWWQWSEGQGLGILVREPGMEGAR